MRRPVTSSGSIRVHSSRRPSAQGVLNEVQPGSYAFMDRDYREALQTVHRDIVTLANAEVLPAHGEAVTARFDA